VGVERRAAQLGWRHLAQAVGEEAQGALGGNGRVELAHRAGGGIARVDKGFLALGAGRDPGALPVVQRLEVVPAHIDLAADFEHGGCARRKPEGYLANRADVLRHVLAHLAIAARGCLHQYATLIAQAHGQAVKLELGHVVHRRIGVGQAERAPHAGVEILRAAGFGIGLGVDRQHRHGVTDRLETVEHLAANALRGRIRRQEFGVRGFKRLQFTEQPVVLGVGNLRRIERVVAVRVVVQLGAQFGSAYGQRGGFGRTLR
jgi:hypothetical protein